MNVLQKLFCNLAARLRQGLVSLAVVIAAAVSAMAAEEAKISVSGNVITLDGPIVPGVLSKLLSEISNARTQGQNQLVLSLNSDGGSFDEGLNIAELINTYGIGTIVKSGNRCASACALIFLGGATPGDEDTQLQPFRTLQVGAKLGFHAPYTESTIKTPLDKTIVATNEAHKRLQVLFARFHVPDSLRPILLRDEPGHPLFDATSMEAIELLDITVEGFAQAPPVVTRSMIVNACLNGAAIARGRLPSATYKSDRNVLAGIAKNHSMIVAQPGKRDFTLLPSTRLPNGDVAVCKIDMAGVCGGFYPVSAMESFTEGETQLDDFIGCQRVNTATMLVDPQTTLDKLAAELTRLSVTEQALMVPSEPQTEIAPVDDEGQDVLKETTFDEKQKRFVCNTRTDSAGLQFQFANMRLGPSGSTELVQPLQNNTQVELLGEARNPQSGHLWRKVRAEGAEGYVDNELLSHNACFVVLDPSRAAAGKPKPKVVTPLPPPPVIEPQARLAVVCNGEGDSVNLRDAPRPDGSRVLRQLFNRTAVQIIGETNNPQTGYPYYKLRVDGLEGYAFAKMIAPSCDKADFSERHADQPKVSKEPVLAQGKICNLNSAISNMREGPHPVRFKTVQALENGTPVAVLGGVFNPESGHPWFKIRANGGIGFIDSDVVTDKPCPRSANVVSARKVMCNVNLDYTNMRSGPNPEMYDVIEEVKNNTPVRVLESVRNPKTRHLWFKIDVEGMVGFVDSDTVADHC